MKLPVFLLVMTLLSPSLFAYVNSYAFLADNAEFTSLVNTVRREGDVEKGLALYEKVKDAEPDGYSPTERTVLQCKAGTLVGRFLVMDAGKKDIPRARTILREVLEKTKSLEKDSFFRLTLEADAHSVLFLADWGDLGSGIAANNATKKAWKKYPDEYYANFLKGNTMLFAPLIGGGNVRGGLSLLVDLYKSASPLLAPWDYASLLSCIGIGCFKMKDWENARGYLTAARTLYPVDSQIDEYLEREELR